MSPLENKFASHWKPWGQTPTLLKQFLSRMENILIIGKHFFFRRGEESFIFKLLNHHRVGSRETFFFV